MGVFCLKRKRTRLQVEEMLIEKFERNTEESNKIYFKIMNDRLKRFYLDNRNSMERVSISIDKNDFNSMTSTKTMCVNPKQNFIHWSEYFLSYLEKLNKNKVKWANELISLFKQESFITEGKFTSLFFWQEFEIKNNENSSFVSSNKTTFLDKPSFLSYKTSNISINDPTYDYKLHKKKVKCYIQIIKEHIENPEHPINIVARLFSRVFIKHLFEHISDLEKNNTFVEFSNVPDLTLKEITKTLQKFIVKLQTSLRLIYCKTINYQSFIDERDDFMNIVTTMLFNQEGFYYAVYSFYEVTMKKEIKKLEDKMRDFKKIVPADLGIHQKFSLNEDTIMIQKKILDESKENQSNNQELLERNRDCSLTLETKNSIASEIMSKSNDEISKNFDKSIKSSNISLPMNSSQNKQVLKINIKLEPYTRAITFLQQLEGIKSPYEKMNLISKMSNEITACVGDYWKDYESRITSSFLNIDADELMSIFIYIIIKSQMKDLIVHTRLVKEFTSCMSKNTMVGYYFVTLDASLIYILGLKDKNSLKDSKEILKNSFLPDMKSFSAIDQIN